MWLKLDSYAHGYINLGQIIALVFDKTGTSVAFRRSENGKVVEAGSTDDQGAVKAANKLVQKWAQLATPGGRYCIDLNKCSKIEFVAADEKVVIYLPGSDEPAFRFREKEVVRAIRQLMF